MLVDYVSELDEVKKGIADAKTRDSQANADYEKARREGHSSSYWAALLGRRNALLYLSNTLYSKKTCLQTLRSG
jgi:hypothetical protein